MPTIFLSSPKIGILLPVKEVEYLRHTITNEGIHPQPSKVDAILKIAQIKSPLAQQAMLVVFPNPYYPFLIKLDASDYQLGYIILQNNKIFHDLQSIIIFPHFLILVANFPSQELCYT
jgi:hypothetical protein